MSESRWKDEASSERESMASGDRPDEMGFSESSMTGASQASKGTGRWKETADDADVTETPAEDEVRFGGKGDREPMEMDMTPMVDVTFLLLIFFMVTASFTLLKTIKQPPPSSEEPSTQVTELEDNPDYVLVFIDEFNTYTVVYGPIEAEAPSEQELYVRLREAMASSPALPPTKLLVKAHGDATHERVVTAMDAGTEVGLSQVQVMLTEQESL